MNKLRTEYSSFKKLLSITGFGWNPVLKIATTEDASLWDVHVKLVDIFGDVYASGDGGVGNAEAHLLSDGDGDDNGSPIETTNPVLHRQEYQEDEHLLNDELFAPDPVETPNPIRQNQYDNNIANCALAKVNEDPYSIEVAMDVLNDMVGLEDEEYSKAAKHVVESQAWRVAFIKALPERRAILMAGAPHIDDESIDDDLAISNFFLIISNNSLHTKEPIRDSRLTGVEWVVELRFGHSDRIYEAFRMERFVFNKLCTLLIQKGWLADSRYVRVDEQLGIFVLDWTWEFK
ncbi:hypothetical protein K1719_013126 [Acacia pycnantha]|nr:hypothetical protein K1719_013126 [Acacia pycnantha]